MSSVRRIAYVVSTFPKLSESFIANELAELRRRGSDVLVLALRQPVELLRHEVVSRAGLDTCTVYERANFEPAVRSFAPDVIHAHFATEPAAVARDLADGAGVPFTFTAHGHDVYRRAPEDFAARALHAAAVVTVSEANARWIVDRFGVPRAHIRVIPSGVDTERFRPNGGPAAPSRIVCVARLAPVKNLGLLLAACAMLRDRGLAYRAVLVGDGRLRQDLEAMRIALGLERDVELAGAATQDRVLGYWHEATIAALSSDSEGIPVSLMEAGACGVPAVATAVGGVGELVEDGVTGLLTRPGDAQAFAAALERLLRDRALAIRLGASARRRVVEHFSLAGQVDRLLSLWAEVRT
jgi:colanic acid/amylovoran biosynthesis glycosyltransferase